MINSAVLKKSNGAEIKLLKMKNMWGTNEWVGDWSDNSLKWTQEFKKEVGLEPKQDGIFWISYEDYLQFYTTTHICKIHPNYDYTTQKIKSSKANNEQSSALTFYGSSFITDEIGEVLEDAGRTEEKVILHTFDLAQVEELRFSWGLFRDRRPEMYGEIVK